jgi:FMN reductase
MTVLGVVASPSAASRTCKLVEVVLEAAGQLPAVSTELITFAGRTFRAADGTRAEDYDGDTGEVVSAIDRAQAVVFGFPVYRGSYPGMLKNLLDIVPRGQYDGHAQALRAKPVAIAATGGSDHHFLGMNDLAAVLSGFFAAYVIPPGLYASHTQFADGTVTSERVLRGAAQTGHALVAMSRALESSPALRSVEPLI